MSAPETSGPHLGQSQAPGQAQPGGLEAALARHWPAAVARWSRFLRLRAPTLHEDGPAIAWIDLSTRAIGLSRARLADGALDHCIEGLLAHEIGHHVRWPGSPVVGARLQLLERGLLPITGLRLHNLFTDFLINCQLGRDEGLRSQLCDIYRVGSAEQEAVPGPMGFLLALFEEHWALDPGALSPSACRVMQQTFPRHRADAAVFLENIWGLRSNLYTQFLYFLHVMTRYVPLEGAGAPRTGCCVSDEISPEDWARALTPMQLERAALAEARARRWFPSQAIDSASSIAGRVAGLPGAHSHDARAVPQAMAAWYRLTAERYLIRPPPTRQLGEPVVPTAHRDWTPADPVADIDWLASLSRFGPELGAALPLLRERVAEYEGQEVALWQGLMEVYLDVSGSMPDPRTDFNALTLAGLILVVATIRAGGRARAALYSGDFLWWDRWSRSESDLAGFLMHYIGGGTRFPFQLLERSFADCGAAQPTRVIITDRDFDANVNHGDRPMGWGPDRKTAPDPSVVDLLRGCAAKSPLILVQLGGDPARQALYRRWGIELVRLEDMRDLPRAAAALARALFPTAGPAQDRQGGR